MSEVVIDVCKQLAEELVNCPEYIRMDVAQSKARRDAEALRIILDYREKYNAMTEAFGTQDEDPDGFRQTAQALRSAEDAMQANELVSEMLEAQKAFSALLNEVNTILQAAVSGSSGCTGSCATCSGCSSVGR